MTRKLLGGVFALLILSAGIASADTFFFHYNSLDNSINASGTITATLAAPGRYAISDITGFRNGEPVTFIPNPGTGANVDNTLIVPPNPGYLSYTEFSGFVIHTSAGDFNPFYGTGSFNTTPGHYYEYKLGAAVPGPEINFGVPDGSVTFTLLGCALVGIETLRRKFRA